MTPTCPECGTDDALLLAAEAIATVRDFERVASKLHAARERIREANPDTDTHDARHQLTQHTEGDPTP